MASAVSFAYASVLGLYFQLGILLIFAIIGTATFVYVEWNVKKEARVNSPEMLSDADSSEKHD